MRRVLLPLALGAAFVVPSLSTQFSDAPLAATHCAADDGLGWALPPACDATDAPRP